MLHIEPLPESFHLPLDLSAIHTLAKQGETEYVEFKLKANHPDKLVKEMVAFANAGGGLLLLGVSDEGKVKGVKYPEEEAYSLEAALHKYAKPIPLYDFQIVKVDREKSVVAFQIAPGKNLPYYWLHNTQKKIGRPYVRYQDMSLQASREWQKLLKLKQRQRELTLEYGQTEQRILAAFKNQNQLRMKEIQKTSKLPLKKLSYNLVRLTYCNVLELRPAEGGDIYTMKTYPEEWAHK